MIMFNGRPAVEYTKDELARMLATSMRQVKFWQSKCATQKNEVARLTQALERCAEQRAALVAEKLEIVRAGK